MRGSEGGWIQRGYELSEGKQIVGFPNLQLPQSRFFFLCLARRYDEAIEAFDRALAIDPDDEVVRYHRNAVIQRQDLQEMAFPVGDDWWGCSCGICRVYGVEAAL